MGPLPFLAAWDKDVAAKRRKGSLLRDILTIIASIVIVILAVAVAAPPFIDWEDHRETVDRLISRASGTEAKTEGAIGIRLLPDAADPLDRLRLGGKTADSPTLTADIVWAEVALTPLLRGEVRFLETRIGRADISVSVSADGELAPAARSPVRQRARPSNGPSKG